MQGGNVRIEVGDVTDESRMREIADRVAAEWGHCSFLINGAGGNNAVAMPTRLRYSEADLTPTKDFDNDRGFWDIDLGAFKSVLEINTLGTVIPSRAFGLQMARNGGARYPLRHNPNGDGWSKAACAEEVKRADGVTPIAWLDNGKDRLCVAARKGNVTWLPAYMLSPFLFATDTKLDFGALRLDSFATKVLLGEFEK